MPPHLLPRRPTLLRRLVQLSVVSREGRVSSRRYFLSLYSLCTSAYINTLMDSFWKVLLVFLRFSEKTWSCTRVIVQWRHSESSWSVVSDRGHQCPKGSGPHRLATALFPWYIIYTIYIHTSVTCYFSKNPLSTLALKVAQWDEDLHSDNVTPLCSLMYLLGVRRWSSVSQWAEGRQLSLLGFYWLVWEPNPWGCSAVLQSRAGTNTFDLWCSSSTEWIENMLSQSSECRQLFFISLSVLSWRRCPERPQMEFVKDPSLRTLRCLCYLQVPLLQCSERLPVMVKIY